MVCDPQTSQSAASTAAANFSSNEKRIERSPSRRVRTFPRVHFSDFLATGLLLFGLGAGLRHSGFGDWALAMGVAAGLSVCLIFWLVQVIDKLLPGDTAAVPSAAGFDADDTLFVVAPLIWLGWAEEFLIVAAIGAPIALVVTMLALWRLARRA